MIIRRTPLILALCSASLLTTAASCSPPNERESTVPSTHLTPRPTDAPILGEVSASGDCDPEVIDIDHRKPSADISYTGRPGDAIDIRIVHEPETGGKQNTDYGIRLDGGATGWQIPSGIPNATIHEIVVTAVGGTGVPGECRIPVNGINGDDTPDPAN
ncbi:hypothetical protein [Corynebacterium pygosceleis]|uniref:Secreted protein n=1 Tax=Corynebacterium pygosceleis TaxID=2800406 RepID=A0A9Q4C8X7_9CORY|nr:hypothetical protein [Corynebacterium pygosceleis]MCK7638398.1 hypothetical protein [Corynebacterium pygosceleis]MCK7675378.1 hypothetical protein [Corynebacterium pygosceleis]MCL0121228.1 hypothetical protein [Corynebacterium pygosceleis]MCX7469061.1 hypothetical protein [Corynebacterium pygosceleis]